MYDKGDIEAIELCFKKAVSDFPKMRYKVKEIFGDYYYEEMSVEETIQKVLLYPEGDDKILRSQADINAYIRDNLNVKMPLDGPLFRVYVQNFEPTDQDGVPEAQKSKSFLIWKCHHSFCDGVSVTSMTLAISEQYNRDFFLKSKDATFF
jgi:NRPS condensation-like uncharacterized protein